jgi:hypothetical protein
MNSIHKILLSNLSWMGVIDLFFKGEKQQDRHKIQSDKDGVGGIIGAGEVETPAGDQISEHLQDQKK